MNKSLFLAMTACAAMAMTSCSSEDLTSGTTQANESPISFSTYLGRAAESRASVISGSVPNFGVFAFYTGKQSWAQYTDKTNPNFMHNQEVKGTQGTDGTWSYTYSPLKYWPNNDGAQVSFFAYAPYNSLQGWENSGSPTITIPTDVKDQIDILVAPAIKDQTKQTVGSKLTFNFKHALCRIGFEVAYAADGTTQSDDKIIDGATTITLSKIELHKAGDATDAGVFYTKGSMDMTSNGSVFGTEANTVQAFTLTKDNFKQASGASSNEDFNVTNEYKQLNADDSYLMIIPQDFSGESNEGFDITVTYTVATVDNNNAANNSIISNEITKNLKLSFEAGKAYNLKLLLGMTSVKIDASSTDWTSSEETVELPANQN